MITIQYIKFKIISVLDWIDDYIINHRCHPWLCNWLANHSWWGENGANIETEDCQDLDSDTDDDYTNLP